jgi:hypothetical protein
MDYLKKMKKINRKSNVSKGVIIVIKNVKGWLMKEKIK